MPPATTSRKRELITALSVLILIAVIVTGVIVSTKKSSSSGTQTAISDTITGSSNSTSTTSDAGYKDGTYTADSGYNSPGGFEKISVKLTVANNKVTDATVTTTPTDDEAEEYQSQFQSGYKSYVVGKAIDSIKLSRVSGSSLTSQGFNSALETIKKQAANS